MTHPRRAGNRANKRHDTRAGQRSTRRASKVDPARRAAYDVLHEVGARDGYSNLVLRQVLAERGLDERDAAFATELALGTLRHRGTLDAVLAVCIDRPLAKIDPRVLDVLRLGAYQLLFLATADHAAVSSTVELAREVAGEGPSRFTNAVMRAVARNQLSKWLDTLAPAGSVDSLALRTSHPSWIVSALRDALGEDSDELPALLDTNNEAPSVTLVARPDRCDVEELLAEPDTRQGRWSPYAVSLGHGRPGSIAAVREQRAGVQDEGSQLIVLAFLSAAVVGEDSRWLDLCAGPGGKAALLADLGARRGASLVAVEPREARARLVEKALAGSAGTTRVVVADGRDGPWSPESFDRVLVDAPCSGLGVLRRRPESRWRRSPEDVAELARLQRELLLAAVAAARPGGIIGYATCSPHIAETDLVVDDVLARRNDLTEESAVALLPDIPDTGPGPRLRLWPHRHGTDGMFLSILRRTL